ncbi:HypC/HybG/HupF family hydrogenase formation chaperone [Ketobacter alkanivorans]|uniref:Hydrogenase assembly protein HupF n=1 Tax=Ketobacter alkanivorans TaxID=1917421 RepID=A0A2K9LQ26_9GAMM|nr:HypC/HybG/HupF family hydrogenase formation chaperone [Ketobacter alkanivorans]AUM14320.1 hypothetical protein Kalk_18650 [Ketobacter alkanivorans]MCP5018081.1 HypC/HybG/HupF family hydrogenase formation chaperone [Ketobacter sp.]
MCLGVPGQIVSISDHKSHLAVVDISGVKREVNVSCVIGEREPIMELIGVWVLVHVGFAMSRLDENEARRTLALLSDLGEFQESLS